MEKKKKKLEKFSVLKIIAFKSGPKNFHIPKQDTCHWQSMCYETHLRFHILLRDIFWKSSSIRVMKKYHESAFIEILHDI